MLSPAKLRKTREEVEAGVRALGALARLPDELLAVAVPRWLECTDAVSLYSTCRALAALGSPQRTWRAMLVDFKSGTGLPFDHEAWVSDVRLLESGPTADVRHAYWVLQRRHVLHRELPYLVWLPAPASFAYQLRKNRATLLDWMLEVSDHLKCSVRTPFMAALLLERYKQRVPTIPLLELQGVGGACLVRAMAMYGDSLHQCGVVPSEDPAAAFAYLCDGCYSPERMQEFMDHVAGLTEDVKDQELVVDYVRRLLTAARKFPDSGSVTFSACSFVAELVLVSTEAFRHPVPAMAAAIFSYVCYALGISPAWVKLMFCVSGYTLRELQEPMMLVHTLVRDSVLSEDTRRSMTAAEKNLASCVALIPQLPTITTRFWHSRHLRVASIITKDPPLPPPPDYGREAAPATSASGVGGEGGAESGPEVGGGEAGGGGDPAQRPAE